MTVWSETNDPEEIYTLFRDPVPGYDGRPIGISDVLELYDADGSEFYSLRPCRLPADRVCTPAENGYGPVK
ncbi:MAG: YodL domain-containing protein [Acutalibacteraceae bacterium]